MTSITDKFLASWLRQQSFLASQNRKSPIKIYYSDTVSHPMVVKIELFFI
jgi:hypothetical protein